MEVHIFWSFRKCCCLSNMNILANGMKIQGSQKGRNKEHARIEGYQYFSIRYRTAFPISTTCSAPSPSYSA